MSGREGLAEAERCPGCGSVASDRFRSCRVIGVDVTQVGYRYLADTWGYCRHLGRHIGVDETPWLAARDAAWVERLAAERDTARREAGERIAVAIEATRVDGSREWGHACNAAARIARADALASDDGSGA